MSILCVGSVALDSVETPFGKADRVLGGSAVYFSAAATVWASRPNPLAMARTWARLRLPLNALSSSKADPLSTAAGSPSGR